MEAQELRQRLEDETQKEVDALEQKKDVSIPGEWVRWVEESGREQFFHSGNGEQSPMPPTYLPPGWGAFLKDEKVVYANLQTRQISPVRPLQDFSTAIPRDLCFKRGLPVDGWASQCVQRLESDEMRMFPDDERLTVSGGIGGTRDSLASTFQLICGQLNLEPSKFADMKQESLGFLLEELHPEPEFWFDTVERCPELLHVPPEELEDTMIWLEEFLWNQPWATGFGRQRIAEAVQRKPHILIRGIEGLEGTLDWLQARGLDDEAVEAYVQGPTAAPYPVDQYPWLEFFALGRDGLEAALTHIRGRLTYADAMNVAQMVRTQPNFLLNAATAAQVSSWSTYVDFPLVLAQGDNLDLDEALEEIEAVGEAKLMRRERKLNANADGDGAADGDEAAEGDGAAGDDGAADE